MTKRILIVALTAGVLAAPSIAADKENPGITNRVLDLLNAEVVLDGQADSTIWESAPFETSRFNRIGLRFSADVERGAVTCRVCWRYSPEDECIDGVPVVTAGRVAPLRIEPPDFGIADPDTPEPRAKRDGERPDGIPDLYLQDPRLSAFPPTVDFAEVRGLWGQVRCSLPAIDAIVPIGDDPSLIENPEPIVPSATVTDVKVLLRRD